MKIRNVFSSVFNFLSIAFIIYAAINIIHFSWKIAEPEGFWGFIYFIGVLGVVATVTIVAIAILFFLTSGIIFIFSEFPRNLTLKNIVKPLGYLLLIVGIILFNTIMGSGISLYVSNKMSDKYSYINRSEELIYEGRFVEAVDYSKEAYHKYSNIDPAHPFFILTWLFQKTDYNTKTILEKQYSTTINYAQCLDITKTDLELVEKLYNDALTLSDTLFLKEEQDYKIFPYLSLADMNLNKGNYVKAETYFSELLRYSNKSTKDDLKYIWIAQERFAAYHLHSGDFTRARILREQNVEFWEKNNESLKSIEYLSILLSASSSEIISQNYDKAGQYLCRAMPLAEKRSGTVVYPVFLLMKGIYCNYVSLYGKGNEEILDEGWIDKIVVRFKGLSVSEKFKEEAETSFLKILDIENNSNGNKSIEYVQGLHRLASFYLDQGDKIKANQLLKEAKQKCEKYKSTNVDLYYTILLSFTISEYSLKGYEAVKNKLDEIEKYQINRLNANYAFLTENERETYKCLFDNNIAPINSVYILANSPDSRKKLYNNTIATKVIALYANENIRNYLGTLNDSLQNEYFSTIKQRDSIENIGKNKFAMGNEEFGNSILLKEKAIQKGISSKPGFIQFDPRAIKWNNISTSLKEKEIAIEFVHSNINNSEHYFALVITKDIQAPELIPLFEEPALKKILNQPGNSEERINAIYGKFKDSLFSLIWKPIEARFNFQKAYISVSGLLYGVSFSAFLDNKNIDVLLLGSTRYVAMKDDEKTIEYKNVALIGGVNYGKTKNNKTKSGNNRSSFSNLPYTYLEIQDINNIIKRTSPDIKVNLLTENLASESSFRNLEKGNLNLIHLATHGYYYSGNNFSYSTFIPEIYNGTNLSPMLRSGVVLAGANTSSGASPENDGFLSAQEIARMNFVNLDLAVLSACETGLGETIGSEGVFGLQRAFKLAGAKSLIMSLWKVPDEQTSELMALFYKSYMTGLPKSQALREAQIEMKKKYKDPYKWGGFILLER